MFHCPVGVYVIEQHAIILSATVRSPTVFTRSAMHAMLSISKKSGRCKTFGPTTALYTCGTNERMDDSHIKTQLTHLPLVSHILARLVVVTTYLFQCTCSYTVAFQYFSIYYLDKIPNAAQYYYAISMVLGYRGSDDFLSLRAIFYNGSCDRDPSTVNVVTQWIEC